MQFRRWSVVIWGVMISSLRVWKAAFVLGSGAIVLGSRDMGWPQAGEQAVGHRQARTLGDARTRASRGQGRAGPRLGRRKRCIHVRVSMFKGLTYKGTRGARGGRRQ